jgi:glycosyltransferase involved in cell wall biosynthesis
LTVHDISVMIPYYNESKAIEKTLGLISSQTISPKEVFFVDSYFQDSPSEMIIINKL